MYLPCGLNRHTRMKTSMAEAMGAVFIPRYPRGCCDGPPSMLTLKWRCSSLSASQAESRLQA